MTASWNLPVYSTAFSIVVSFRTTAKLGKVWDNCFSCFRTGTGPRCQTMRVSNCARSSMPDYESVKLCIYSMPIFLVLNARVSNCAHSTLYLEDACSKDFHLGCRQHKTYSIHHVRDVWRYQWSWMTCSFGVVVPYMYMYNNDHCSKLHRVVLYYMLLDLWFTWYGRML